MVHDRYDWQSVVTGFQVPYPKGRVAALALAVLCVCGLAYGGIVEGPDGVDPLGNDLQAKASVVLDDGTPFLIEDPDPVPENVFAAFFHQADGAPVELRLRHIVEDGDPVPLVLNVQVLDHLPTREEVQRYLSGEWDQIIVEDAHPTYVEAVTWVWEVGTMIPLKTCGSLSGCTATIKDSCGSEPTSIDVRNSGCSGTCSNGTTVVVACAKH